MIKTLVGVDITKYLSSQLEIFKIPFIVTVSFYINSKNIWLHQMYYHRRL